MYFKIILFLTHTSNLYFSNINKKLKILDSIYMLHYKYWTLKRFLDCIFFKAIFYRFDTFKYKINATNKQFRKNIYLKNTKYIIIYDNDKKYKANKFEFCLNLINININANIIYGKMFINCIKLKTVKLINTKKIDKNAFENCISLEKIYIPKNIKYIDIAAFKNCINLKYVIFY